MCVYLRAQRCAWLIMEAALSNTLRVPTVWHVIIQHALDVADTSLLKLQAGMHGLIMTVGQKSTQFAAATHFSNSVLYTWIWRAMALQTTGWSEALVTIIAPHCPYVLRRFICSPSATLDPHCVVCVCVYWAHRWAVENGWTRSDDI